MSKILALVSHVPNPRANRRMGQLAMVSEVELVYWNKGGESCIVQEINNVCFYEINIRANRTNPIKRKIPFLKFAIRASKIIKKSNPQIIYAERFDMLIVAWFNRLLCLKKEKPKIIFEVPDLPHIMIDNVKGLFNVLFKKSVKILEQLVYKSVDLLIVTSTKFYDIYYKYYIPEKKVVYMPNIPDFTVLKDYKHKEHNNFTIGYIGVIRYPKQLLLLMEAAAAVGADVLLAGFTENCQEVKEIAEKYQNVIYYGQYDYNKEIVKLYEMCDAIFSVYDAEMKNVGVALPNKLYEAVYCKLPIIVAKSTYLGEIVESHGIGITVTYNNKNELQNAIMQLMNDRNFYSSIQKNCTKSIELNNIEKYTNEFKKEISSMLVP